MKNLLTILLISATTIAHGQSWEIGIASGINNSEDVIGAINRLGYNPEISGIYAGYKIHKKLMVDISFNNFHYSRFDHFVGQDGYYDYQYHYKNNSLTGAFLYRILKLHHFSINTGLSASTALEGINTESTEWNKRNSPDTIYYQKENYSLTTLLIGGEIAFLYRINHNVNIGLIVTEQVSILSFSNDKPFYNGSNVDAESTYSNSIIQFRIGYKF